ncbi:MAG: hypothetical protein ACTHL8_26565 [Burkholderiaceae bacterium]
MHVTLPIEPVAPAPPPALLRRFDRPGLRDLALPPLASFSPSFGAAELREALGRRGRADGPERRLPLHLLASLPGEGCADAGRSAAALAVEAHALAAATGGPQAVARVVLRGCGVAAIDARQLGTLLDRIARDFRLDGAPVRVDARWPGVSALRAWRAAGVSRLVLDDARAPEIEAALALGYVGVTARVACGRRGRDPDGVAAELREMMRVGVARVCLHEHAGGFDAAGGPMPAAAGAMPLHADRGVVRARAIAAMLEGGFRHVGLDLFARRDDPLVVARDHGRLCLEVDGLGSGPAAGTLAIGAGAFGRIGARYYRNAGGPRQHAAAGARDGLSAATGVVLSPAALAHRSAVASLVCHGRIDFEAIALAHLVEPRLCFTRALRELAPLVRAGLVRIDDDGVELTPPGEHLVEVVAGAFERNA